MSATATKPRAGKSAGKSAQNNGKSANGNSRMTRDQAADALLPLLKNEPQTEASLARLLGINLHSSSQSSAVTNGLAVLESRHQARKVPHRGRTGWVGFDSEIQSQLPDPQAPKFPPPMMIRCDEIFVPPYQRPVTSLVNEIRRDFQIPLFGTLTLSDRGPKNKKRYAVIDGQTRWKGASDIGVIEVPALVFTGMSQPEEARLFVEIQLRRKGVTSWYRFRGQLFAEDPESLAIQRIAKEAGYVLGDGEGQLRAVGSLEASFRKDQYLLERTLVNLKAFLGKEIPDQAMIRGLHYFFRNYPIEEKRKSQTRKETIVIDDGRLVRRLQTAGVRKIRTKADAAKEMGNKANEKAYGIAIQAVYQGGG